MTNTMHQKVLLGKLYITGFIEVKTGLHIGGGGETLEIGGLDKGVVRDPITNQPYIPGSSLKGKLRSILERLEGKPVNRPGGSDTYRYESDDLESGFSEVQGNKIPFDGAKICPVSRVFGSTGRDCWIPYDVAKSQGIEILGEDTFEGEIKYAKIKGRNSPAKLIVRDCHLNENSVEDLQAIDTGLYMTEWKFENGLDRITAAANPRQIERVPRGSIFDFEMIYTVECEGNKANSDQQEQAIKIAQDDLTNILKSLWILEDDALGGHGSRGYGKVRFEKLDFMYKDYQNLGNGSGLQLPEIRQKSVEATNNLSESFEDIKGIFSANQS